MCSGLADRFGKMQAVHGMDQRDLVRDLLHFIGLQMADKLHLSFGAVKRPLCEELLYAVLTEDSDAAVECEIDQLRRDGLCHGHERDLALCPAGDTADLADRIPYHGEPIQNGFPLRFRAGGEFILHPPSLPLR